LASTSSPTSIDASPPVAALELERDTAQERFAGDVLTDVGCDYDSHDS
jgi:hypothetical protein